MKTIEVYFDGVCEPCNPYGYGAYGLYIIEKGKDILKGGMFVGKGKGISNNVAEYSGFVYALKFLKSKNLNDEQIIVRGDSKLVIEQMSGYWRIKQGIYVQLALEAKEMLKNFRKIKFEWIPREENGICDKLAKDVLRNMGIKFKIQPDIKGEMKKYAHY